MGGDTFSGCGSEPSHQHERGDLSYTRGYEWALLQEAMKRNPDIITYGLPWGFPAWIGNKGDANAPGQPLSQASRRGAALRAGRPLSYTPSYLHALPRP